MRNFLFVMLLLSLMLNASEIIPGHDYAQFGQNRLRLLQGGLLVLQTDKLYCKGSLTIGTRAGYFSFASADTKSSFVNPDKGFWQYSGIFPANTGATMAVRQTVELTPMGMFEINISWEVEDPKDNKDTFYSISCPISDYREKNLVINNKEIPVLNENKYGWYSREKYETAELVFYQWDADRAFKITCSERVRLVTSTTKDKEFSVRIYPAPGSNKLTLTLQVN